MRVLAVTAALLIGACAQAPTHADEPAVIVDASPQSRAELRVAVMQALGIDDVTLADDALTRSSTLWVERAAVRDTSGRQLEGRSLERPEKFSLVRTTDQCVLVHERTGRKYPLVRTRCNVTS